MTPTAARPILRIVPPDGVCNACWLFAHLSCERRASCRCSTCHPNRVIDPPADARSREPEEHA